MKRYPYFLRPGRLPIGQYLLQVNGHKTPISILPVIDKEQLHTNINRKKALFPEGTLHTLLFKLEQLKTLENNLRPYETGDLLFDLWAQFQTEYQLLLEGQDPYQSLKGPYRRAFKSKYDQTYQPYTIKLPKDYDPSKAYPLLVFLHGSGQEEQQLLNDERSNGQFIELAPYGRDKFRAYAEQYSQKDIVEAIEDVQKHFPVVEDQVIIGGFSMGGYGALRTFHENPKLYKGVAVFAGHPNLANEWLDGQHPNFLEPAYLNSFQNIPVFIYHGAKDPALKVELIEQMAEALQKSGARVTKSIAPEKGHEYQDSKTHQLYTQWLAKVIQNK